MARSNPRVIVKNIISELKRGPKSIKEISETIGANRKTVKNYLDSLEDSGILRGKKEGRKKVYFSNFRINHIHDRIRHRNTYFDLPISEEQENIINFLFHEISREWKNRGNKLSKTVVHKILAIAITRYRQYHSIQIIYCFPTK